MAENCLICSTKIIKSNNKSNNQKYCSDLCSKIAIKKQKPKYNKKYYDSHKTQYYSYSKKWRELNREYYLQLGRNYYQQHKKENSLKCKEYSKIHRKQLNRYLRTWKKEYPESILIDRLRKRIWDAIKNNYKSAHTLELLGCSIESLRIHLQKQFTKGMSWSNYGKWHIDHIKPCASFDLFKPKEQRKCFNYTNLQPLWAEDNLRKGIK